MVFAESGVAQSGVRGSATPQTPILRMVILGITCVRICSVHRLNPGKSPRLFGLCVQACERPVQSCADRCFRKHHFAESGVSGKWCLRKWCSRITIQDRRLSGCTRLYTAIPRIYGCTAVYTAVQPLRAAQPAWPAGPLYSGVLRRIPLWELLPARLYSGILRRIPLWERLRPGRPEGRSGASPDRPGDTKSAV